MSMPSQKGSRGASWKEQLGSMGTGGIPSEAIFAPSKKEIVTDNEMYIDRKLRREVDGLMNYLYNPGRFGKLGYRGVIFKGPPGTGKTLLAWYFATAMDANVFFYESTSGIRVEDYWKKLFDAARQYSLDTKKWSFIFIDEIESIVPKREDVIDTGEARGVSQILRQMDSLHGYEKEMMDEKTLAPKYKLLVIGATNMPDKLDPAARRGGRFDKEIEILAPDKDGRRSILDVHNNMQRGFEFPNGVRDYAVEKTPGYTGGDLRSVFVNACEEALRESKENKDAKLKGDRVVVGNTHVDFAIKRQPPSGLKGFYFREPDEGFDDILGYDSQKKTLKLLVVDYFRNPEVYEKYGLKHASAILLYGPSGTNKTKLARAVAKEAQTNLMFISGPEIYNKFFGESEKIVRDIFQKARYSQPTVVVFDMIDSFMGNNDRVFSGASDTIQKQLLLSLDNIPENVVVIATTHDPERLDKQMFRPEAMARRIYVGLPDKDSRTAQFKHYLSPLPKGDLDYDALAEKTNGYSCKELEQVCENAKFWSVLNANEKVNVTQGVLTQIIDSYPHVDEDSDRWERLRKELSTASLEDLYVIK
jgi:transitional endoplasmic reticulum ATPase